MGTLRPRSNGPLYSNMVHWPLMVSCYIWYNEEGLGGATARPVPPRCTKCNSSPSAAMMLPRPVPSSLYQIPPISSQCTNLILFDVAPELPLHSKWLINWSHIARTAFHHNTHFISCTYIQSVFFFKFYSIYFILYACMYDFPICSSDC